MNETVTTPEEQEDDTGTSRRSMDAELRILGAIIRTLNEVEEPAQSRIVAYIANRYAADK